jgi:hypothetical protein
MPRSPVAGGAGNVNLKGKKYKLMLPCGCCYAYDFRDKYKEREDKKLIREIVKAGMM